jgi:hypothetical protein
VRLECLLRALSENQPVGIASILASQNFSDQRWESRLAWTLALPGQGFQTASESRWLPGSSCAIRERFWFSIE